MKFPIVEGRIVTLRVDQKMARKCYKNNLRNRKGLYVVAAAHEVNTMEADLEPTYKEWRPKLVGRIKEMLIGEGQIIKVGAKLLENVEAELLAVIKRNMIAYPWLAIDMHEIDLVFLCHLFVLNLNTKP